MAIQSLKYARRGVIYGFILALVSLIILTVLVHQNDELYIFFKNLILSRLYTIIQVARAVYWWIYLLLISIAIH